MPASAFLGFVLALTLLAHGTAAGSSGHPFHPPGIDLANDLMLIGAPTPPTTV